MRASRHCCAIWSVRPPKGTSSWPDASRRLAAPTEASGSSASCPRIPASLRCRHGGGGMRRRRQRCTARPIDPAALGRLMPNSATPSVRATCRGPHLCLALAIVVAPKPPLILLTSPPAAWTTRPRPAADDHRPGLAAKGRSWSSPPTTWSWSPTGRPRGGPRGRGADQRRAHPGGRLPLARPRSPVARPGPGPVAERGRGRIGADPSRRRAP